MSIYLILKKANRPLSCIRKSAGIADVALMIAPDLGLTLLTGRYNSEDIGGTRKPGRSLELRYVADNT